MPSAGATPEEANLNAFSKGFMTTCSVGKPPEVKRRCRCALDHLIANHKDKMPELNMSHTDPEVRRLLNKAVNACP
jgi:hypothetical protein